MFAVGIDVSNGRSTVAVLQSKTTVTLKPFEVSHTPEALGRLVNKLNGLNGETKVIMEHTGRYYESIAMFLNSAGIFVSAVNPILLNEYQDGMSVRKVKTDKADAIKIAKFGLDNWDLLRQYEPMDTIRYQLKTMHRQFQLASKSETAFTNNLIALLEQTYPRIRKLHEKAAELYRHAQNAVALVPKSDVSKMMVKEAVSQLNVISRTVETYRAEMNRLASQLPEYETVMGMYGAGPSTGPQLMAEIGDIRRFPKKNSIIAYAGIDPGKDDSGDVVKKSNKSSKRGSPYLRKTLFVVMDVLIQNKPADDPVYQFLDKKRSEGKPYYVYMTAGGTKFLRHYYGKVRDCLKEKGLWDQPVNDDQVSE